MIKKKREKGPVTQKRTVNIFSMLSNSEGSKSHKNVVVLVHL